MFDQRLNVIPNLFVGHSGTTIIQRFTYLGAKPSGSTVGAVGISATSMSLECDQRPDRHVERLEFGAAA